MKMKSWLLVCGLLLTTVVSARTAVQEIRVAFIDRANPPFVLDPLRPGLPRPGITPELLHRVEWGTGVRMRFLPMPWARCLRLLKSGEVDAIFHASFLPSRRDLGVYPEVAGKADTRRRLLTQTYYIYKLRDSPLEWDGKAFTGLDGPLGVVIDFSIKRDLDRRGLVSEEAPDTLTNLRKLVAGRVTAVINYASQTDTVLQRHPEEFADVVKLEPPFKEKVKYLMFSHAFYRDHGDLVERIWDELDRVRRSGEYSAIEAAYVVP